jgi:hypothetical protein
MEEELEGRSFQEMDVNFKKLVSDSTAEQERIGCG